MKRNTHLSFSDVFESCLLFIAAVEQKLLAFIFLSAHFSIADLEVAALIYGIAYNKLRMCQLLGMNCAKPTDFTFSFTGFAKRGGDTDIHSDGWGLVFYEGCGIRAFHDSLPASKSPISHLVSNYPCKTLNMISHIRYATSGACLLENVHPFQREIWGIPFVFAHNGDVPNYSFDKDSLPHIGKQQDCNNDGRAHVNYYVPIGTTDSEAIFCAILNSLRKAFDAPPPLHVLYTYLQNLASDIIKSHASDECVIFNFLMSCGEHFLFAFSWPGSRPGSSVWNGLYYVIREYPFHMASLKDCDMSVDFSKVTTKEDRVAVVATTPLTTDEAWNEFKKGELLLFYEGTAYSSAKDCKQLDDNHKEMKQCRKQKM